MHIQWYPGHMTKAKRMMEENLKLIDVVIEILDARLPISSQNPDIQKLTHQKPKIMILNKVDLADNEKTKVWAEYFKKQGYFVIEANSRSGAGVRKVIEVVKLACKEKIDRNKRRGLINKPMRAMVIGIPNVGKSTFINKLVGKSSAKTGNKPGVTKGKQWLKVKSEIELMDTPGVLWPKFEDQTVGQRLAMIGSIKEEILDNAALAGLILEFLKEHYPTRLLDKYPNMVLEDQVGHQMLEQLAAMRNLKKAGDQLDTDRMALILSEEFRNGKFGPMTLETVEDFKEEAK